MESRVVESFQIPRRFFNRREIDKIGVKWWVDSNFSRRFFHKTIVEWLPTMTVFSKKPSWKVNLPQPFSEKTIMVGQFFYFEFFTLPRRFFLKNRRGRYEGGNFENF